MDAYTEREKPAEIVVDSSASYANDIGFGRATFTWSSEVSDGTATPSRRAFRLHIGDDLIFRKGVFNLIIGPTGSGKTSILMALLGEMHYIPSSAESWKNLPREGGVAYAAQESWVQNETIRVGDIGGLLRFSSQLCALCRIISCSVRNTTRKDTIRSLINVA